MRKLLVLGAGTAGTMAVNKLRPKLDRSDWQITVVDADPNHYYQPGFLFVPFGKYSPADMVRAKGRYLPADVDFVIATVEQIVPDDNRVVLADGRELDYEYLIIATGTSPRPERTPGLADDLGGRIHEFYSLPGAGALAARLAGWQGGRLVVHVTAVPIKSPFAPLEFAFLADAFLAGKGIRDDVEITYVTPLEAASPAPVASQYLGNLLDRRNIKLEPDFAVTRIDAAAGKLIAGGGREIDYDLLVTVPVNLGADYLGASGLGDDLNYVAVDKQTLRSDKYANIFVLGDASNIPTTKAGAVAHSAIESFTPNFLAHVAGRPMPEKFDGRATCFVETGRQRALRIDCDYGTQAANGKHPAPLGGPLSPLKETRSNHLGKLTSRWVYWNVMLRGRPLPAPVRMFRTGMDA
ncbi:MAG: NAD(P)/FAD-dependent oxidoreductase [Candidatus Nanopelagicales bacterium]